MARIVPLTPELEIIFQGKKNGLDLYNSATNVVTIRPGSLHIHNGFVNFLFQTTEWNTIDVSSGNDSDGVAYTTSWYFVTVDKDGTFRTHAGTGADTERPSDTVYSWVDDDNTGFRHDKQGYYYNSSERIIGAFYRSTDIDYVINNYDITNEVGENSLGFWRALSDGTLEQHTVVDNVAGSSATWTFPVPFIASGATCVGSHAEGSGNSLGVTFSEATTTSVAWQSRYWTDGSSYNGTLKNSLISIGRWR